MRRRLVSQTAGVLLAGAGLALLLVQGCNLLTGLDKWVAEGGAPGTGGQGGPSPPAGGSGGSEPDAGPDADAGDAADASDGDGGPPCQSMCAPEGSRTCSTDGGAALVCQDQDPGPGNCLKWATGETCSGNESCDAGHCTPGTPLCCTVQGTGCCAGDYGDQCCPEAADCQITSARNGAEVCDDQSVTVDPATYRYFLVCLNGQGGIAYAASNSGGPCGNPLNFRCQCWEQQNIPPWTEIQYVSSFQCAQAGQRSEVIFPAAGDYWIGVHAPAGGYALGNYCPAGTGCSTCVALISVPQ